MSADIINLPTVTYLDLPIERVLEGAGEANLSEIVILGFDEDGDFYFSASKASGGDVLWLLEKAKLGLLTVEID